MKKIRQIASLFLVVLLLFSGFPCAAIGEELAPAGLFLEYMVYVLESMKEEFGDRAGFIMVDTPFEGEDNTVVLDSESNIIKIFCRFEEETVCCTILAINSEYFSFLAGLLCSGNVGEISRKIPHEPYTIKILRDGAAVPMTQEEMEAMALLYDNPQK